jgi:hypothetical protein
MTGYHYVRPHIRRTGTRVRGHYRRNSSRAGGGAAIIALLLILAIMHSVAGSQHTKHSAGAQRHRHEVIQSRHSHPASRGTAIILPRARPGAAPPASG